MKGIEIIQLARTNPRQFWSKIKPKNLTKCKVESNLMFNHFKNVLGSPASELPEEIVALVDNINVNNLNIDELDSDITEEDVVRAIKNLIKGKSPGLDNTSAEILHFLRLCYRQYFKVESILKIWLMESLYRCQGKETYRVRKTIDL